MNKEDKLKQALKSMKIDPKSIPSRPPKFIVPTQSVPITRKLYLFGHGLAASLIIVVAFWFAQVGNAQPKLHLANVHTSIANGVGHIALAIHSQKDIALADFHLETPDHILVHNTLAHDDGWSWLSELNQGVNHFTLQIVDHSLQQLTSDSKLTITTDDGEVHEFKFVIHSGVLQLASL